MAHRNFVLHLFMFSFSNEIVRSFYLGFNVTAWAAQVASVRFGNVVAVALLTGHVFYGCMIHACVTQTPTSKLLQRTCVRDMVMDVSGTAWASGYRDDLQGERCMEWCSC